MKEKEFEEFIKNRPRDAFKIISSRFSSNELLKVGNRSYVNAFKFPDSKFDPVDLGENRADFGDGPPDMLQPHVDPLKLLTDKYIIPPSQMIFKSGGLTYRKEDWGQIAGGITDSQTVIQAAINPTYLNGGGLVFCKAGTYDILDTINIWGGISLMGEWAGLWDRPATRFLADASLNVPVVKMLVHPDHLGDKYFPHISKIFIQGNSDPLKTGQHGLHISNENGPFADSFVDHVWCMMNGGDGFYIHDGKTYLTDIYPENNKGSGIYIAGQTLIDITRAYCFGNIKQGIIIINLVRRCNIRDSWLLANVLDGLYANNMNGYSVLNIEGCDFDGNQRYNLYFGDVADFRVTNNNFRSSPFVTDKHIAIAEVCDYGLVAHNSFADVTIGNTFWFVADLAINIKIKDNKGFNPRGLLANPFNDVVNMMGIPTGAAASPTASTTYIVRGVDLTISSSNSGNANCAIMVYDANDNPVLQAAIGTIQYMYIPIGYKITWGAFTGAAPTVIVIGN